MRILCFLVAVCSARLEAAETWIFAGQSNMKAGAQFNAFRKVVAAARPGVRLQVAVSQGAGKPIEWWNDSAEGWTRLTKATNGKTIAGMVWYQGESNTGDGFAYESKLRKFIARVRKLVGNPKLPTIIVQLGCARPRDDSAQEWGYGLVRDAQRRVASADKTIEIIPAMDQPLRDRIVHLTNEGHAEIGRRAGRAALRLLSKKTGDSGPRSPSARFADRERTIVELTFAKSATPLRLEKHWAAGLTAAPASALAQRQKPAIEKILVWPTGGIARGNRVWFRFPRALPRDCRLGWGLVPSSVWGPARAERLPIRGLTNASHIPAPAFLIPIAKHDDSAPAITVPNNITRRQKWEPDKPLKLAINFAGNGAGISLTSEAGAPDYRQQYWNTTGSGRSTHLIDHNGRITPISVSSGVWYGRASGAKGQSADTRMMRTNNNAARSMITGLDPKRRYTLILYADIPGEKGRGIMSITVRGSRSKRDKPLARVDLIEPQSNKAPVFDFQTFIEAGARNKFVGNWIRIPDLQPVNGLLIVEIAAPKPRKGEKKIKPALSGLQILSTR